MESTTREEHTGMSVVTEDPTITAPTEQAEAERSPEELFRWRGFVHIGAGAAECEHGEDGKCSEDGHFHAFIRLPNPYQVRDISEKARAAQARFQKLMRDEDSDPRVILEAQLAGLLDTDKKLLVEEILDRDFGDDYQGAIREVDEMDDPDHEPEEDEEQRKLYAHLDQDREEYARQRALPEEQRSEDYAVLEASLAKYAEEVEAALRRRQAPRREALEEKSIEELVDIIRKDRIDAKSQEAYLHTYNTWQMYVCTLKPVSKGFPRERVWPDVNVMKFESAPEIIPVVRDAFDTLEGTMVRSRRGKGV